MCHMICSGDVRPQIDVGNLLSIRRGPGHGATTAARASAWHPTPMGAVRNLTGRANSMNWQRYAA